MLLLTTGEVARLLGLHHIAVVGMCQKGLLRFVLTPGGQRRILRDSLEEFLKGDQN